MPSVLQSASSVFCCAFCGVQLQLRSTEPRELGYCLTRSCHAELESVV